jgi:uncharacterized oxidoreductase
MKTTKQTVLITGGGSGIGLAIAKLFSENDNKVIITGRNKEKLQTAAASLKNVHTVVCDSTRESDVDELVKIIKQNFSDLSILVNNAGVAYAYSIADTGETFRRAEDEMRTNYLAVTRLTDKFLPLLKLNHKAAVVNTSSIVALVPSAKVPTYSASKAALHAYTQLLRFTLSKNSAIKVFELMPPLVNTEFSKEIGGENGMDPLEVAQELLYSIEHDIYEIQIGATANLFKLLHTSPLDAFIAVNGK